MNELHWITQELRAITHVLWMIWWGMCVGCGYYVYYQSKDK